MIVWIVILKFYMIKVFSFLFLVLCKKVNVFWISRIKLVRERFGWYFNVLINKIIVILEIFWIFKIFFIWNFDYFWWSGKKKYMVELKIFYFIINEKLYLLVNLMNVCKIFV